MPGLHGFEIDETGKRALLIWNVAGGAELALVDLATGKSRPITGTPFDVVGSPSRSRDGRLWALAASGADRPTDVWMLDGLTGRVRQLTRSAHPGVALDRLVRPELVRFTAHDGFRCRAGSTGPPARTGPGPVVLSSTAGPEGQERPTFRRRLPGAPGAGHRGLRAERPRLRRLRQAVRQPRQRRPAGGGREGHQGLRRLRWSKSGVADPKRLGIMGGSYGGYMVMAGLTEYPELFAAGADLFGIVNFETFFAHTEPWMAAISTVEYGDPETQAELLQRPLADPQAGPDQDADDRPARRERHQRAGGRGRAGGGQRSRSAACRSSTCSSPTRATGSGS